METVLDALKAMEKATAREIAARLAIEPRDALEMLNEQQDTGTVTFLNGYWSLSGVTDIPAKTARRKTREPKVPQETAIKIGETQMLDAIREHGPQTAEDLASLFGITSRKVTSTLAMATGKGRLNRVKRDGKFWYCLTEVVLPESDITPAPDNVPHPIPDTGNTSTSGISSAADSDNTVPAPKVVVTGKPETATVDKPAVQEAVTLPEPEMAEVVQSIPSSTCNLQNNVIIPAPRFISAEIRRTEAKLKRLQAMRELSRVVHKPGNRRLWQRISQDMV